VGDLGRQRGRLGRGEQTAARLPHPVQPVFTESERLALDGFLAGYRGLTREAYTLDLRQFTSWCRARSLPLFSVRRADIETFARALEGRGRARAHLSSSNLAALDADLDFAGGGDR